MHGGFGLVSVLALLTWAYCSVLVNGYDLFLKCVVHVWLMYSFVFVDGSVSAIVLWW
jgi:hypothetical protein